MDKLILATNNEHKIKEIRQILSGRFNEILSLRDAHIDIDVVEDGDTFFTNALKKAETVCRLTGMAALADDTGLEVTALGGEPGVLSARYCRPHDDAANNAKLLENLKGETDRRARFVTCVVLYRPDGSYFFAEGEVCGRILNEPAGDNGFGYDKLFYCDALKKSFGECSDKEKNSVSHRARAILNLLEKL